MGTLVALLVPWVLWVQFYAEDPIRAVGEHDSVEACREHADRLNQIFADTLDRNAHLGGSIHGFFRYPFLCMPKDHVPRPRRQ
jgi:hypothetical protein